MTACRSSGGHAGHEFRRTLHVALTAGVSLAVIACTDEPPRDRVRVSGYVEATEVHVAPEVGGRLLAVHHDEGDHVTAGAALFEVDATDTGLAMDRARAERARAVAQLDLLVAGARREDIARAEADVATAEAELAAVRADLEAARVDYERFADLLRQDAGTGKQRDDAAARRDVAEARVQAGERRLAGARAMLDRLQAGSRPEEIAAARAAVDAVDAQIATLKRNVDLARVHAPLDAVVTERLAEPGEIVAPYATVLVLADLNRPWATVYVDEPDVPRLRLGQEAQVMTDAGGPAATGRVSFISPQAEFTPRNVQTAEERSRLVYRVKITLDNRGGRFKIGMPVEAELPLGPLDGDQAATDAGAPS